MGSVGNTAETHSNGNSLGNILNDTYKTQGSLKSTKRTGTFLRRLYDCSVLRSPLFLFYCFSNLLIRVNTNGFIVHLPNMIVTKGFSSQVVSYAGIASGTSCTLFILFAGFLSLYPGLDHVLLYSVSEIIFNSAASIVLIHVHSLTGVIIASLCYGVSFGKSSTWQDQHFNYIQDTHLHTIISSSYSIIALGDSFHNYK